MFRAAAVVSLLVLSAGLARADDLVPMDTSAVDPALLVDFYGPWIISDESGARTCRVVLEKDATIGGSAIEVDPGCAAVFPVMDEIASWRLLEGWGIALADATRKTRLVFTTPDERYVARDEVDGIFTIAPEE